jgi:hypothetical protein
MEVGRVSGTKFLSPDRQLDSRYIAMSIGILGRKVGMTQIYDEAGQWS